MTNTESFALIASAISNTDDALARYDSLSERAASTQETVAVLEAEIAALHRNDTGLDAKARGSKFTVANSALSLAKGDLQSVQESLAAQRALTAATGQAAASALFEVRDLLQNHRVAKVTERLLAEFDWSALHGVRVQDVANAHKSVRSLGDLGVSLLYFELQHDDGFTIGAVRHLEEHWRELKQLVESEPGLELSIAPVQVPTISKPKPAPTTTNQLGTLAQAVAA